MPAHSMCVILGGEWGVHGDYVSDKYNIKACWERRLIYTWTIGTLWCLNTRKKGPFTQKFVLYILLFTKKEGEKKNCEPKSCRILTVDNRHAAEIWFNNGKHFFFRRLSFRHRQILNNNTGTGLYSLTRKYIVYIF